MRHVTPRLRLAAGLLLLVSAGCGGAPTSQPAADTDEVGQALDGARPGEHGCGSCVVRACAAGAGIDGVRVELELETSLDTVRYDKAVVRVVTADGRGEALALDTAKLAPSTRWVQAMGASQLSSVKTASDLKGASGALMLYWTDKDGPKAQQLPMAVEVGGCK